VPRRGRIQTAATSLRKKDRLMSAQGKKKGFKRKKRDGSEDYKRGLSAWGYVGISVQKEGDKENSKIVPYARRKEKRQKRQTEMKKNQSGDNRTTLSTLKEGKG